MSQGIDDLVTVIGNGDAAATGRVRAALSTISECPEVMETLAAATRLHGRKVEVHVSGNPPSATDYRIYCNLRDIDRMVVAGQVDGVKQPVSLERFLTHEIAHTAQENTQPARIAYHQRVGEIVAAIFPDFLDSVIAMARERDSSIGLQPPARIRAFYDRMFAADIKPKIDNFFRMFAEKLAGDEVVCHYAGYVEWPAIRLENKVARRLGQVQRPLEYWVLGQDEWQVLEQRIFS